MFDRIEEALEDLRRGRIVIVCDDEDRENEGDFVCLADHASPEVINFMAKEGRGLICVPITEKLAGKLRLDPMIENNTDSHGTAFTVSIDHIQTTTGISAFERSFTIRKLIDEKVTGEDFKRPGHVFPLIAKNGGVLERAGHTEAAVDLAILCGASPAGVICEIMNEDGTMARVPELAELANKFDMKMITIADLIQYRLEHDSLVQKR
ncbi:3,4-dihydroxy-2-butanone-4-phosphate synthase [Bacillus sp. V3-13]|nr:3,4-dihydroxy-2-butanone-4-phosphate synthase [Bacillus sp. V3-13]